MLNSREKTKIAVFISGGGTNLQALIDAQQRGEIPSGEICFVFSNNKEAYGLKRAEDNHIDSAVLTRSQCESQQDFEERITALLKEKGIQLIVLAGFMTILSEAFIKKYPKRIINVHPSLIPSFCGRGFYGMKVHEKALEYGVKVTGATVHYVNEIPDGGEIIYQKAVDILPDDTPKTLQKRVMEQAEWRLLPMATEYAAKKIREEK